MSAEESKLGPLALALHAPDAIAAKRLSADVMNAVAEAIGASAAWLYRRHDDTLELVGTTDEGGLSTSECSRFPLTGASVVARCFATGSAERRERGTPSASDDLRFFAGVSEDVICAAPLFAYGRAIGVLVHTSPVTELARHRLEEVACIAALAISAMPSPSTPARELVDTMQVAVEKLLDQVAWEPLRRSRLFGEATHFDERAFLTVLAEGAARATHADLAAVGVGTDPTRAFDPWVFVGIDEETEKQIGRHPRPVATLGAVAIRGKTLRLPELADYPSYVGLPPRHPPVHSFLAVPIRIRGRSFGNVYLANKRGHEEFSDVDQQVMQVLASLAALGLHFAHLATSELELNTIIQLIETAPEGMLYLDRLTGCILVSHAYEVAFGQKFDPTLGIDQMIGLLCWPDGRPLARSEFPSIRALRGEVLDEVEHLIVRRDGTRIPIAVTAGPFSEKDTIRGGLVFFRDLTAQKEAQRVREEFAAMVVHDLRNPIQSMLLQIEMMRDASEAGVSVATEKWDRLTRAAMRLARMATDMLDSTRIELSKIALHPTRTDAASAVRALVDNVQSVFSGHRIVVDAPEHLPPIGLDIGRFEQLLTNLIENAVKNSARGTTILVTVRMVDGGVDVAVHDEGNGIAPEELPKLFDRIYQAKRARERRTGLGLGLHIVKGLVEAHGGRIHAESVIDEGSTFHVWFPALDPFVELPGPAELKH